MAITRCPYCHAIIDEADKYCNNCGTQLLFPEDDEVDEEIPGEKIIDAEVEDKDYTVDEPEGEKHPGAAADDDGDIDERLEEEMKDRAAETALDELVAAGAPEEDAEGVTEEVILVDEIEEAGAAEETGALEAEPGGPPTSSGKEEEGPEDDEEEEEDDEEDEEDEKDEDADQDTEEEKDEEDDDAEEEDEEDGEEEVEDEEDTEEIAAEAEGPDGREAEKRKEEAEKKEDTVEIAAAEPEIEYLTGTGEGDGPGAAEAETEAPEPVTFDTRELEGLGRTVELGKDRIDAFIEGLSVRRPAAEPEPPAPPPGPAAPPAPARDGREPTGALPPWASGMKGAPVFPPDTTPVEPKRSLGGTPPAPSLDEEVEIFPRKRGADSTMGLPERLAQAPLPFSRPEPEDEDAEAEPEAEAGVETTEAETSSEGPAPRPDRPPVLPAGEPAAPRRIEAMEDYEEAEPRGPFSFSVFFKSKLFDALFVGLFWLVALWLAAHATDRTLFEVLGSVSGPMLLLYGAFLLLYFFLFRFFLGETLGDRLFRPRD